MLGCKLSRVVTLAILPGVGLTGHPTPCLVMSQPSNANSETTCLHPHNVICSGCIEYR